MESCDRIMGARRTKLEILSDSLIVAGIDLAEASKITKLAQQRIEEKRVIAKRNYSKVQQKEYKVSINDFKEVMLSEVDLEVHQGTPLSIGATHHCNIEYVPISEMKLTPSINDVDDEYEFHELIYKSLGRKNRR